MINYTPLPLIVTVYAFLFVTIAGGINAMWILCHPLRHILETLCLVGIMWDYHQVLIRDRGLIEEIQNNSLCIPTPCK